MAVETFGSLFLRTVSHNDGVRRSPFFPDILLGVTVSWLRMMLRVQQTPFQIRPKSSRLAGSDGVGLCYFRALELDM